MNKIIPSSGLALNRGESDFSDLKLWQPIKRVHYKAAVNWLTKEYKISPTASNLEKIHYLLESFHHFCEAESWDEASEIIHLPLQTPTQEELHNQLGTWGYYYKQLNIYQRLLSQEMFRQDTAIINGIANTYFTMGDYSLAIKYHIQGLEKERERKNKQGEVISLKNLGVIYYLSGAEKS